MEYGCIGEKLSHSFSAEIHPLLCDYKYELKELNEQELEQFFAERNFKGINVTIPYKETVIRYLDEVSDTALKIGAVNTVINRSGKLIGDNTDFHGLSAMLCDNGFSLQGKKVLILGSGGTSKTALAVAKSLGAENVFRLSRRQEQGCIKYSDAIFEHKDAQIIINTTPCGMFPNIGESAIDISAFSNLEGVADVIYNPIRSSLICDARNMGVKSAGGLYMLVAQAFYAAQLFSGKTLPKNKIKNIYEKILHQKQNIVLVGMPGCGKTTVGKILANDLSMKLYDTDEIIEENAGCKVKDIFDKNGEAQFRKLESDAIKNISSNQHIIISTGGGAVLNQKNIDFLRENGKIYFIDRPLECLTATKSRPLSSNKTDLEKRYRERYALYCKCADKCVSGDSTPQQIADYIKGDFLK